MQVIKDTPVLSYLDAREHDLRSRKPKWHAVNVHQGLPAEMC